MMRYSKQQIKTERHNEAANWWQKKMMSRLLFGSNETFFDQFLF